MAQSFSLVAQLGAIAARAEFDVLFAVEGAGVAILNAFSYHTNPLRHPSQTREVSLLATFTVGFRAIRHIELAAALGVLIAVLRSSKSRLHRFAVLQLSEQELRDAILLAGAAPIVLPLLPDHSTDPFGVINLDII